MLLALAFLGAGLLAVVTVIGTVPLPLAVYRVSYPVSVFGIAVGGTGGGVGGTFTGCSAPMLFSR